MAPAAEARVPVVVAREVKMAAEGMVTALEGDLSGGEVVERALESLVPHRPTPRGGRRRDSLTSAPPRESRGKTAGPRIEGPPSSLFRNDQNPSARQSNGTKV